jgi:transposase
MDTSSDETATDTLGRRTAPRKKHTIEEKRRIVEETHARGVSVAAVARRHELNANQVFAWRQLYRRGLLVAASVSNAPTLLPVKVMTPTVLPSERVEAAPSKDVRPKARAGLIEIELSNGRCIRVHGGVDGKLLMQVITMLERR